MDGLSRASVEVDMIKFSGPAFEGVDNRLMSLQLVEQGLTDAAMFIAGGETVQPSEVLANRSVVIERGSFRPVTNVTLDMMNYVLSEVEHAPDAANQTPLALMEMSLSNLMTSKIIDHKDFLDRGKTLGVLGKMVMISNYGRFDEVVTFLRKYTQNRIAMVAGVPILEEIFDEKYYSEVEGGILQGLGCLFQGGVKLYVYPMRRTEDRNLVTAEEIQVAPKIRRLYEYLMENGCIEPIREFQAGQLHIFPGDVLAKIQSGDSGWEKLVPPPVAEVIKKEKLFGYPGSPEVEKRS